MRIKFKGRPKNGAEEKAYCPKCKSKDLNFMPWLGLIYECRKCGWRGPVVVHKVVRKKAVSKKITSKRATKGTTRTTRNRKV